MLILLERFLPAMFWTPQLILIIFIFTILISLLLIRLILFLPKSNFIVPIGLPSKKYMNNDFMKSQAEQYKVILAY